MAGSSKGRKGKLGKNKSNIAVYYNSGQHLFNKARRIVHHLRRYGKNDECANMALKLAMAGMPQAKTKQFRQIYGE
jgi:hypothetical protein